ncbi:MAG: hypothetical protein FWC55_00595 [Firmicutes bacterium]|nr:hypothetical protein [Bacillota bacterium]
MSINPVDLHGAVQSSAEVLRSQRVEPRHPEDAQRHFASQLEKQAQQQEQTVATAGRAENQNVRRDGRGKGYKNPSGKKDAGEQNRRENAAAPPEEGGMLDVLA